MIYLDNAATSWPKPPEVARAMVDFLESAGGNPGRSGHALSIAAGRLVYETREAVAELFNCPDPLRVIFTQNGTQAINLVLKGILRRGSRVVTTGVEHNAVMRPLRALERGGVHMTIVPCDREGFLSLAEMERAAQPGTSLVVVTQANNVTGTILPVARVAEMAHRAGALLLVDAAQTAGVVPIDVQGMGIDLLAFTGHKSLYGPPGTGGLVIGDRVDVSTLEPLVRGGTGSRSEFEEQPEDLPDKFESGTPNGPGIAGLGAGIQFVKSRGIDVIRAHEVLLTTRLIAGLRGIPRVSVYGPEDPVRRTATVSLTIEGCWVSDVGLRLDEEFGILSRVGLHCAPAVHRTIGTFPEGTVRLAPGAFTTPEEIEATLAAIRTIAKS
jgi:cysteine desulfurase/selenocysteine lyase